MATSEQHGNKPPQTTKKREPIRAVRAEWQFREHSRQASARWPIEGLTSEPEATHRPSTSLERRSLSSRVLLRILQGHQTIYGPGSSWSIRPGTRMSPNQREEPKSELEGSEGRHTIAEEPAAEICGNRRRKPLLPSTILVRRMPARLGPRSIAETSKPANRERGAWRRCCGAATESALAHEIPKVSAK